MRLFLTGSTGFIGSHVLRNALAAGHEVRALRRSSTSFPVIPMPNEPIWCEGDLQNLRPSWFEGVDAVINLASAGVSPQQASWSEMIQVNVVGCLRLLEMAAKMQVHRCVLAGTSHEYGNSASRYEVVPPDAPLEPLSAYGASKAAAFQLLKTFAIERQLELFYGRIYSTYGEGQFSGNFWPSLHLAALTGSDFSMTSGKQVGDYIEVTDVAKHLMNACRRLDINPGIPLVVNIGSGIPRSLRSFAESEWKRLGAAGRLIPGSLPDRPVEIPRNVPDLAGL